jgi:hypothetical protein
MPAINHQLPIHQLSPGTKTAPFLHHVSRSDPCKSITYEIFCTISFYRFKDLRSMPTSPANNTNALVASLLALPPFSG